MHTRQQNPRQEQQVIKQNEIAKKPSPQSPSPESLKFMNNKGTVNHLPPFGRLSLESMQ